MTSKYIVDLQHNIKSKLLEYQIPHTIECTNIMIEHNRLLNGSDTGTGKTYSAIAVCAQLELRPFIISPKSVISSWKKAMKHFKIPYYGITNYESLQNCQYYPPNKTHKEKCPFISKFEKQQTDSDDDFVVITEKTKKLYNDSSSDSEPEKKSKKKKDVKKKKSSTDSDKKQKSQKIEYGVIWNVPKDIIVIFDEAHRCKNSKTINSRILQELSKTNAKIMLLSATICDKPQTFAVCGYVLKLYKRLSDAKHWINKIGKSYDDIMIGVHHYLYKEHKYASRMKISELGNKFPQNSIICECFDADSHDEIEKMYDEIKLAEEDLKNKVENSSALAKITYLRQQIELLRTPILISQAKKCLEEGNAVVIFVNFTESLQLIASELDTKCIIYGDQTLEERDANIESFQQDITHVIVCNSRSGGVGISLHDLNGKYPRVSLISPSYSSIEIIQCLGRIHRAGAKTPARQIICYISGTIEEKICENMKNKISNIANINDGNLDGYKIEGLTMNSDEQIGISADRHKTPLDITMRKIENLTSRRSRLIKDLEDTDTELIKLNSEMESLLKKN